MTTIELISQGGSITLPPFATSGWLHNSLVDWYSLTSDKAATDERPQSHGAFNIVRSFRSVATPSFTAVFLGNSAGEYLHAVEALSSIGADGPIQMRVTDAVRVTERTVTIDAVPVEDPRGQSAGEITVDCVARDPRRYSVEDAWVTARPPAPGGVLVWPVVWPAVWAGSAGSDGRVTVTNRGTKSSAPIYRIYGGFTSATITNIATQQQVGFELPVPGGSFVELDFSKRTALLDGVSDATRYITNRSWWDIPADSSVPAQITISGSSVDPYLAGKVRSAW